jgi:hypothetical protein
MPADPLRDQQGKISPHDHDEISDDSFVIRHIVPPHDLHPDHAAGLVRVSSGAYSESSDGGMSVDIESWMIADGLDSLHYVAGAEGATRLRVGDLRRLGMQVGWDPDSGHRHHGCVWGIKGSSARKKVARLATTLKKASGET